MSFLKEYLLIKGERVIKAAFFHSEAMVLNIHRNCCKRKILNCTFRAKALILNLIMGTGQNYFAWSVANFTTHKGAERVGIPTELLHIEKMTRGSPEVQILVGCFSMNVNRTSIL